LEIIFDPAEELEDALALQALESATRGEGRSAKEVMEQSYEGIKDPKRFSDRVQIAIILLSVWKIVSKQQR